MRPLRPRRALAGLLPLLVVLAAPAAHAAGLKLGRDFADYGRGYQHAQATRHGALCLLTGLVTTTSGKPPRGRIAVGELSSDCRPERALIFDTNHHAAQSRVNVYPDGRVEWYSGFAHRWLSLDGVAFVVGGAAKALEPAKGWRNYGRPWDGLRYHREGDLCVLSGLLRPSAKVSLPSTAALLPADCRPPERLIFRQQALRVDVHPTGAVSLYRGRLGSWVSLSGIEFRVKTSGSRLSLLNGWSHYGRGYAPASYRVDEEGTCTLTGLLRAGKRHAELAKLPAECRPAERVILNAEAGTGGATRLDVEPDGTLRWVEGDRGGWVSLAGITLPVERPKAAARPSLSRLRPAKSPEPEPEPEKEPVIGRLDPEVVRRLEIRLPEVLVAHERGGNRLLRIPGASAGRSEELLPGHLSPQERAQLEQELGGRQVPAWIYPLSASAEIREVLVSGGGVTAAFVDPACVSESPQGALGATGLCSPPASGRELQVRFEVAAGTPAGDREVQVRLATGETRRAATLRVARAGSATLAEVRSLPLPGSGLPEEAVDPAALRDGRPLVGQLDAAALRARPIRLVFRGPGVGALGFSAPGCLASHAQRAQGDDALEVRATLRVPDAVDGRSHGLVHSVAELPSAECRWFLYDPALDPVIESAPRHAGKALGNFTFLPHEASVVRVVPRFLALAAVGDSYGSGEGAPDAFDGERATWTLEQCHRSRRSRLTRGPAKVAEIPGVWVVHENFACSGATLDVGAMGAYVGVPQPDGAVLDLQPEQVDQLRGWLAEQGLPRLDALLVSFGGNEVGFSTVIAACVAPFEGLTNCSESESLLETVERGGSGGLVGFQRLPQRFDAFKGYLADRGVDPGVVFLTEYPDPLSVGPEARCGLGARFVDDTLVLPEDLTSGSPVEVSELIGEESFVRVLLIAAQLGGSFGNLSHAEAAFLRPSFLDRVNATVREAAERNGWRFVGGHVEHSVEHGFCTDDSYVNTFRMSFDRQGDVFGSVHPTAEAYDVYGEIIADDLIREFGLPPRPEVRILLEDHSQEPAVSVLGDTRDAQLTGAEDQEVVRLVHAEPTRFRLQLAPTARNVEVELRVQRRNRFSGRALGERESVAAERDPRFAVRRDYVVTRELDVCESLDYSWRVTHAGANGTRVSETPTRTITPSPRVAAEDDHCPRS